MRWLLGLVFCGIAFGNACTTSGGSTTGSNQTTTYTSCGGTTPQPADTLTIASSLVLKASLSVQNITIAGATASLTTDGLGPYTVTVSTGIAGGFPAGLIGIEINSGCTAVGAGCPTAYALDTSAASVGKEVTFTYTSAPSNGYVIGSNDSGAINVWNISHAIINAGSGTGLLTTTNNIVSTTNTEFVGAVPIYAYYPSIFTFNNNSFTGRTGVGLYMPGDSTRPATCSISNNTDMNGTSNLPMFQAVGDWSACTFTGNAMLTDAVGTYYPNFIDGHGDTPASTTTVSYNLAKSYNRNQVGQYGISGMEGSTTHHVALTNNVVDGFGQPINLQTFTDSSGNICIAYNAFSSEQGCFFVWGQPTTTSTNDIATAPVGGTTGNILMFFFGNGTPPSNTTITNATLIGSLAGGGGANAIFGDGNADLNCANPSTMTYSISYGGLYGIDNHSSSCVYGTSGTGGVGISNNNVVNATGSNYCVGVCDQVALHFDNGVTPHPNAIYGDTSFDPKFVNPYRTWANCDAILGGPGTEVNLFTQLFNRWNNSQAAGYTPQAIYNCMHAPYAPREIRVVGQGAVKPILIFTGTQ